MESTVAKLIAKYKTKASSVSWREAERSLRKTRDSVCKPMLPVKLLEEAKRA